MSDTRTGFSSAASLHACLSAHFCAWRLVTAESCTGGGLAYQLTSVPGSSRWFERGFVTYSNEAKQELLGVSSVTLARFGAVSKEVALEMAEGALCHSHANLALAITGVAGPDGGSPEKPVGTVWFGVASRGHSSAVCRWFSGDRTLIRQQAIEYAISLLEETCQIQ